MAGPTWFRVDDDFFRNPKVVGLSKDAKLLYLAALALCHEQGTDGFLSPAMGRVAAAQVDVRPTLVNELVAAGLWHAVEEGGFEVHDYLDKQESSVSRKAARTAHADRMRAWRDKSRDTSQRPSRKRHEASTSAVTNGATNGVSDSAREPAHTHTRDISISGLNHQVSRAHEDPGEGDLDQGKPQVKCPEKARWLTLWPRRQAEAAAVWERLLEHLDPTFLGQVVGGYCMPPKRLTKPNYLWVTALNQARDQGILYPDNPVFTQLDRETA